MGLDPIVAFGAWMATALDSGVPEPHAAALATLEASQRHTPDGHPNLDYIEGLARVGTGDLDGAERAATTSDVLAEPVGETGLDRALGIEGEHQQCL